MLSDQNVFIRIFIRESMRIDGGDNAFFPQRGLLPVFLFIKNSDENAIVDKIDGRVNISKERFSVEAITLVEYLATQVIDCQDPLYTRSGPW